MVGGKKKKALETSKFNPKMNDIYSCHQISTLFSSVAIGKSGPFQEKYHVLMFFCFCFLLYKQESENYF